MIGTGQIRQKHGNDIAAIILCCRVFLGTASPDELNGFIKENPIDWDRFMYLSRMHRIRPVVYKTISLIEIPGTIKKRVHDEYAKVTFYNWKRSAETERIILLLKERGIEALPYKGTSYSMQFYGDLVSRESNDIDLVIDPLFLNRTIPVLKEDGYLPELEDVYVYLGNKYLSFYKDFNLNKFSGKRRTFHIELHWGIADTNMGISSRANALIVQSNNPLPFVKNTINTLNSFPHFSAILIHHSIKDNFKFLKNVMDISQGFKQQEVQNHAEKLEGDLKEFGLKKALDVSVALSWQLMGVSLTAGQEAKNPDKVTDYFIDHICSREFGLSDSKKNAIESMRETALLKDSRLSKIKFYFICLKHRFIPTHADFRAIRLPKSIFFLYYFIKPFRTLIKPFDQSAEKKKLNPMSAE